MGAANFEACRRSLIAGSGNEGGGPGFVGGPYGSAQNPSDFFAVKTAPDGNGVSLQRSVTDTPHSDDIPDGFKFTTINSNGSSGYWTMTCGS